MFVIPERLNFKNANKTPKVSRGDTVNSLEVDLDRTSVGKLTEESLHSFSNGTGTPELTGCHQGGEFTQLYTGHHIHTLCDCWKQCPTPQSQCEAMGENACPLGSAMYAVAQTHTHAQFQMLSCPTLSLVFILLVVYKAGGSGGCSRS